MTVMCTEALFPLRHPISKEWWHMVVIPEHGRLRQDNHEFENSVLGHRELQTKTNFSNNNNFQKTYSKNIKLMLVY